MAVRRFCADNFPCLVFLDGITRVQGQIARSRLSLLSCGRPFVYRLGNILLVLWSNCTFIRFYLFGALDAAPMQVMMSPAGDIEDGVCGHTCLVCPWHNYKISITTGEGFYQNLDRNWVSKGKILQRVHDIEERDDGVYVRFNTFDHEVASDKYACDVSMPILGCSELKQS